MFDEVGEVRNAGSSSLINKRVPAILPVSENREKVVWASVYLWSVVPVCPLGPAREYSKNQSMELQALNSSPMHS
jgi:hypothetical protein